ncbi:MAG: succinylglutamate-semialdehyde dehydrogenase [Bdellovibrionales bacterium]|nr:succinylglutamate-semialdehyde dehydrogenase [Bdellovibrionales bacterium]
MGNIKTYEPIEYKGDFINGKFIKGDKLDGEIVNHSPANINETVFHGNFYYENIDKAVASAQAGFLNWKKTSLEERKQACLRIKELYDANADVLAQAISRETGKPMWESMGEVKAMSGKITITMEHSLRLVAEEKVSNALPNVDGYIRFKPRGVMAVLGPFNFPGHLPNGHIIPALMTGNTVVFKPSEKTPAVGQVMAEIFSQAKLPDGVFNVIQGFGETGKRLVEHPKVDGVLFTGSYDVGLRIKEATLRQYWKILALEMGGKNTSIIWDSHNMDKVIYENLVGCFVTAGQRCSCTSKIILNKKMKDEFIDRFHKSAKKLEVDHWSKNPFMGPLISESAMEKYIRFQDIAVREGAECLMGGKNLERDPKGYYVSPSIYLAQYNPDSVYQNDEIFGPNVSIYCVDEFEEAMDITNSTGFGLVTAVFSQDRKYYEQALMDAKVGLVNWNRTTNGASSRLPFGGMGKSGNDRPSAHFAVNYCTIPVASLEDNTDFDENAIFPGVSLVK